MGKVNVSHKAQELWLLELELCSEHVTFPIF